jgi:hypothetical protein
MVTLKAYALQHNISEKAYYRKLKIPLDIPSHKIIINEDGTWDKIED